MAAIFAKMCGDAMGTGGFAGDGGGDWVRFAVIASAITRFAHRGDVVDVHSQFQHGSLSLPKISRFSKRNTVTHTGCLRYFGFASPPQTLFFVAVRKAREFVVYWLPVVLWMILIFSA